MPRSLMIFGSVAVLVAAGVFEGVRTNRWGPTDDMKHAVARLDRVPRMFGDWMSSELPIAEKVLKVAEATGSVSRVYENKKTRIAVSVLILCGPPGPIGAHTPDVCYAGIGYQMQGKESTRSLPASGATLWTATFARPQSAETPLQVNWAWGVDGEWSASTAPRREFLLRSVLYKLYVSRSLSPAEREANPPVDHTQEFLNEFLPEVKRALSPG